MCTQHSPKFSNPQPDDFYLFDLSHVWTVLKLRQLVSIFLALAKQTYSIGVTLPVAVRQRLQRNESLPRDYDDVITVHHPGPHRIVKRLIGGSGFAEGKWPWLVSLQGKVPDTMVLGIPLSYNRYYCGASLLNERWLLTAAHCFTETGQGYEPFVHLYLH